MDAVFGGRRAEDGALVQQIHAANCLDYLAEHARHMEGAEQVRQDRGT
ncbi:hypothetical protein ACFPOI_29675 [Nonomuraea angiospora]|uniref:Uncharacterized protein n=1 Tax=Nonomuraea angiospora TaxID=46172 RepID=A0ABR9LUB1_9ACTN|nr:hypothetical protein [Nonomuraea angiospora]MBE1584244.1 hypothetical protein [Nonomuraea angiospora]